MLAQIDDYIFEVDSNVTQVIEKFTYGYSKVTRVGNNPTKQKVNGYEMEISFSGYFVLKDLKELEELKEIAEIGKPVWFVQKDSHVLVTIDSLTIKKSLFLKSGEFLKQGFDIEISRYFK